MHVLGSIKDNNFDVAFITLMGVVSAGASSANLFATLASQASHDMLIVAEAGGCCSEIYDDMSLYLKSMEMAQVNINRTFPVISLLADLVKTEDDIADKKFKDHLMNVLAPNRIISILTGAQQAYEAVQNRLPEINVPGARFRAKENINGQGSGRSSETV